MNQPIARARELASRGELDHATLIALALLDEAPRDLEVALETAQLAAELALIEAAARWAEEHAAKNEGWRALQEWARQLRAQWSDAGLLDPPRDAPPVGAAEAVADADLAVPRPPGPGDTLSPPATTAPPPNVSSDVPPDALDALLGASDADCIRFLHLFAGREDVHARQWTAPGGKSGYSPIHQPLTLTLLRSHLEGTITLGVYLARVDDTVTFFALDYDVRRRALEHAQGRPERVAELRRAVAELGLRAQRQLREWGVPTLLEDSGYKGRHLWGFFAEPVPADLGHRLARRLANAVALQHPALTVEAFPKSARTGAKGLGNLVKLPLGRHRLTGRRALFLGDAGDPIANPWPLLQGVARITRQHALELLDRIPEAAPAPSSLDPEGDEVRPLPPSRPAPPPFSEADFEARPALRALFGGCAVLEHLRHKALSERRLSLNERIVVIHSVGHVPSGVEAVNYLLDQCPETPSRDRLKSPLRGHPISCPKIRQRIPEITSGLPCHCAFPQAGDHYPTPTLHRPSPADTAPPPAAVQHTAALVSELELRAARLDAELSEQRRALAQQLAALPDRALATPRGVWRLEGEGDLLAPRLHAAADPADEAAESDARDHATTEPPEEGAP